MTREERERLRTEYSVHGINQYVSRDVLRLLDALDDADRKATDCPACSERSTLRARLDAAEAHVRRLQEERNALVDTTELGKLSEELEEENWASGAKLVRQAMHRIERLERHEIERASCCVANEGAVKRLREALTLAARWIGSDSALETFEDIAAWFYAETGMLRPGKSMPLEMGESEDEKRREAFRKWADEKGAFVRRTMREALAEGAEEKTEP